jgi:pimeloyl-ACP methyl ester carboxylesterase
MNYHVIAVDGTGPGDDREYFRTMADSFCMQIEDKLGKKVVDYDRGPSDLGSECGVQSDWVVSRCELARKRGQKIFLAGYSRGGAVVVNAAYEFGHPIDSLFLFDAVDRTGKIDAYRSQCNVDYVFHVRRDCSIQDPALSGQKYSRGWFGNCGLSDQWPKRVKYRQFTVPNASHAAVGGVPWLERAEDKPALRMAAQWMSTMMQTRGITIVLEDKWFGTIREAEYKRAVEAQTARIRERAMYVRQPY